MRITTSLICAALLFVMSKCDKSDDNTTAPGHCNGLVTDTSGTGDPGKIYIPSAFTPNGDGHNDVWRIPGLKAVPVFELSVFNRWGQLIYHVKNNNKGWDGQFNGIKQPSGGYTYMIRIGNGKRLLKGVVMLVR